VDATAAELLELLSTSASRWSTLRATGREWRRPDLTHEAWEAGNTRIRNESVASATVTRTADAGTQNVEPDEVEKEWHLWLAPPWKRAQFVVGTEMVDVVIHGHSWWSNIGDMSITNAGAQNSKHGEGYGGDLVRTANYVQLINVEAVTPG